MTSNIYHNYKHGSIPDPKKHTFLLVQLIFFVFFKVMQYGKRQHLLGKM